MRLPYLSDEAILEELSGESSEDALQNANNPASESLLNGAAA
jgi:hypothetical protein